MDQSSFPKAGLSKNAKIGLWVATGALALIGGAFLVRNYKRTGSLFRFGAGGGAGGREEPIKPKIVTIKPKTETGKTKRGLCDQLAIMSSTKLSQLLGREVPDRAPAKLVARAELWAKWRC